MHMVVRVTEGLVWGEWGVYKEGGCRGRVSVMTSVMTEGVSAVICLVRARMSQRMGFK